MGRCFPCFCFESTSGFSVNWSWSTCHILPLKDFSLTVNDLEPAAESSLSPPLAQLAYVFPICCCCSYLLASSGSQLLVSYVLRSVYVREFCEAAGPAFELSLTWAQRGSAAGRGGEREAGGGGCPTNSLSPPFPLLSSSTSIEQQTL